MSSSGPWISELGLAAVLRQLPVAVVVVEAGSLRIVESNDRAREMAERQLGEPVPEALEDWWEIFHPDGRPYLLEERPVVRSMISGDVVDGEEYFSWLPDGRRLIFRSSSAPIYDDDGEIVAGVLVMEEITEQKQVEEERAYHASLLANVDDAVVGTDTEFRLTVWNSGAERLYGYPAEEVLGRDARDVATYAGDASRLELEAELLETGRAHTEITAHRKDGTWVTVELIAVSVRDSSGAVAGYLGIHRDVTERKRAEESLREANRRTETILESISDTFFAVDREWRYTYVNERAVEQARKAWGRDVKPEELLGKNCWELFPQTVGTVFEHTFHRAVREQEVVEFETYSLATDSWVEVRAYPSADGLSVYSRDVTQRRRARETLAYHASLLDNVEDAVIEVDRERRTTTWNTGATRMYGWSAEEALGRSLPDLLPTDMSPDNLAQARRELEEHGRWRGELMVRREDASMVSIDAINVAIRDDAGHVTGYLGIHRDITGPKQAQEAVREANQRSEMVLESIGDNFFAIDSDWRITYMNQRALRTVRQAVDRDLSLDDLLGKNYWELLPDLVGTELDAALQRALRERHSVAVEVRSPVSGAWYEVCAYPSDHGLSVFARDISDRKRSEERVIEAREVERGRIARALHDEALQGLSDAIVLAMAVDRAPPGARPTVELLARLRRVGEQLRGAIYDLRLGMRERKPFTELLEQLVEEHREMASNCEISLQLGDGVPTDSLGDSGLELLLVIGEALTNARRHGEASHVRVRVWEANGRLSAEVSDDGRGFDTTSSGSPLHHGVTGMREHAKLLGGHLEIHTELGVGTTVRLDTALGNEPRRDT